LLKKAKIGGEQTLSTPGNFLRYLQQNGALKTANGNPILAPALQTLLNIMPAKNYVRQSNASGGSNQSGGTPTPRGARPRRGRRGPQNLRDELTARIARYEKELETLRSAEVNQTNATLRQVNKNMRAIKNAEFEIAKANAELTRLELSELQTEYANEVSKIIDGNNTRAQALQMQICELQEVLKSQISNIKTNFQLFPYP
jgi:chromosome segregation ATPase